MRRIAYIFVLVSLTFCCNVLFAQGKNQIRDRKIKSVNVLTDDMRKGSVEKKSQITHYDKKGNEIEEIEYNENGSINRWVKYSYDKDSKSTMRLDSTGRLIKKSVTVRDKWENVLEESNYDGNENLVERVVFVYNNFNDLVSETTFDKSGVPARKAVYEYESKGLLKSKKIYDENGKLIYSRTYTYEH